MSDSVVSIHSASGTLAKQVIQQAPEGMLIAPVWKRISLYARHPSDNHCAIIHHSIARWATDYCRVIAIQLFFRRTKVYCILFDELGDLFCFILALFQIHW